MNIIEMLVGNTLVEVSFLAPSCFFFIIFRILAECDCVAIGS